jgi:flagellar biosynthetic protein FliO
MAMQLLKTIAVLAAVLAMIFALAYVLRKLKLTGRLGEAGNEGWRVLAVKHLGPRRQIFILEVGARLLLLGVTDRSMTPLLDLTDPAECDALRDALGRKKRAVPTFQDFLRKADS